MLSATFAECHNKPFMLTDHRYAERRYDECHYVYCCYAECRYGECHYAECRYAECRGASILWLWHRSAANLIFISFPPIARLD